MPTSKLFPTEPTLILMNKKMLQNSKFSSSDAEILFLKQNLS